MTSSVSSYSIDEAYTEVVFSCPPFQLEETRLHQKCILIAYRMVVGAEIGLKAHTTTPHFIDSSCNFLCPFRL